MRDHSQNGEQKIILDYFGDFRGTFLDIGCNDFLNLSNTRALFELGWNGVLVDASRTALDKITFPEVRGSNHCEVVHAAITNQDGPIDLWESGTHLKNGDVGLLSTTKPEEMGRWKKSGEQFTKVTVNGMTFKTFMRHRGSATFQFVNIDCEGADYSILGQMDLTALGVKVLCVEANQSPHRQKFVDYAAKHGMKLHWKSYENCIFVRA